MRLISLVLALAILAGIIVVYKDSLFSSKPKTDQTVKQQTQQMLDEAHKATDEMRKALEEQNRRMQEMNK